MLVLLGKGHLRFAFGRRIRCRGVGLALRPGESVFVSPNSNTSMLGGSPCCFGLADCLRPPFVCPGCWRPAYSSAALSPAPRPGERPGRSERICRERRMSFSPVGSQLASGNSRTSATLSGFSSHTLSAAACVGKLRWDDARVGRPGQPRQVTELAPHKATLLCEIPFGRLVQRLLVRLL